MTMTGVGSGRLAVAVAVGVDAGRAITGVSVGTGCNGTRVGPGVGSNVSAIVGMAVTVGGTGVAEMEVAVGFGEGLLQAAPKIATTTRIQGTAPNFRALTPSPLGSSVSG